MKVIIDEGKSGGKKGGGGIAALLPILFLFVLAFLLFAFIGSTKVFGENDGKKPTSGKVADGKGKKGGKKAKQTHHTIRKGDTYTRISRQHGVPIATLKRLNPSHKERRLIPKKKIRLR